MTAFEIHLNGRKKCIAGIDGDGVVLASLTRALRSQVHPKEHLTLTIGGLISRTHTHVSWLNRELRQGDEIKIVITEKARAQRPKKIRSETAATRKKREQAYVQQKAAEYGWKIVKR